MEELLEALQAGGVAGLKGPGVAEASTLGGGGGGPAPTQQERQQEPGQAAQVDMTRFEYSRLASIQGLQAFAVISKNIGFKQQLHLVELPSTQRRHIST
jgi:hypothetical protein